MDDVAPTIKTPLLQRLYGDWDCRRCGRALPSRADFDPLDLRYIIGNLSLIEVSAEPRRYRFRVCGTNIAERTRRDLTGKDLDVIQDDPQWKAAIREHFDTVVAERAPIVRYHEQLCTQQRSWNCESLVLPLSGDGGVVDMLIGAVIWL